MSLLAGLGIVGSIANGIIGGSRAKKAMRAARREKNRLSKKLESLESQRQDIVNPYADAEDLSGMISDLSGNISNPFANLGVATQAAEMQSEQADIALANTLDTIRATGSGAGGATALAQAALQSKKGVSASIETQEAANEKVRAQGEQASQQRKMQEQQRVQSQKSSLRGQYQQMMGQGEQFQMTLNAQQEQSEIDRTAAQMAGQVQAEAAATAAEGNALMGAVSGAFGSAASAFGGSSSSANNSSGGGTGGLLAGAQSTGVDLNVGPSIDMPLAPQSLGGQVNFNSVSYPTSDRRLKNNIKLISRSKAGLNIYSFNYKDDKTWGKKTYQGVMSDEIPTSAVIKHEDGFDRVDYSKIDVEFKSI